MLMNHCLRNLLKVHGLRSWFTASSTVIYLLLEERSAIVCFFTAQRNAVIADYSVYPSQSSGPHGLKFKKHCSPLFLIQMRLARN
jgi:hypothetical protein